MINIKDKTLYFNVENQIHVNKNTVCVITKK